MDRPSVRMEGLHFTPPCTLLQIKAAPDDGLLNPGKPGLNSAQERLQKAGVVRVFAGETTGHNPLQGVVLC